LIQCDFSSLRRGYETQKGRFLEGIVIGNNDSGVLYVVLKRKQI